MLRNLILAVTIVSSLAASTTQADHRSRGGGGWGGGGGGWGGIGIGGRNFQLNISPGGYGNGYGGYGYGGYGNGGYGPGYYDGYYGPSYYGGTRYYYSSPYDAPGQVDSGSTVVTPVVRSRPPAPTFDGGFIALLNPATNSDSVEYTLNGESFVMRPGQSQRFARDRDWIVEFDRGDGRNFARYGLKSVTYKFKPTARGWELFEQANPQPFVGALPPPPSATLPAKPPNPPQPADEPRPADLVLPPAPKLVLPPAPKAEQPEPSDAPETVIRPRTATKPAKSDQPGPKLTD